MRRVVLAAALVLAPLGASEAGAITRGETTAAARYAVRGDLAANLSTGGKPAPSRIYACRPGVCRFTVRGTATCSGVVRVRERPTTYEVWFRRLSCY